MDGITYVGLDVHLRTLHGAVVTAAGEDRDLGVIANTPKALHRMLTRISDDRSTLRFRDDGGTVRQLFALDTDLDGADMLARDAAHLMIRVGAGWMGFPPSVRGMYLCPTAMAPANLPPLRRWEVAAI